MGLVSSTTLSLAIIEERDDDVARIIRYNPHLLHRVVHAEKGFTPLQLALYLRREYLALVFIVAGADVNAPDMVLHIPILYTILLTLTLLYNTMLSTSGRHCIAPSTTGCTKSLTN